MTANRSASSDGARDGTIVGREFGLEADTIQQDWHALARRLSSLGHALDLESPPRQFAGGFGNLNYLVRIDGADWVLRRPPMGPLPPGANDMAREYRVLAALAPHWALAPRPLLFCEEAAVLGAPFLIMEYRPGLVVGGKLPDGVASEVFGPRLSRMLVDVLSAFHAIDPARVGLGDFAKPAGFLARAIAGWTKRADIALNGMPRPAEMRAVIDWLEARPIPEGAVTLLHNDFKLDNMILDPETLRPRAVVDWDMGSRGDPLFDVATLLSYWAEPGDPPCMHRIQQMPTALPGFHSRAEALDAYAHASGRDVSDFAFYRILTMFKLAVVFLQLEARQRNTGICDPRLEKLAGLGGELMTFTCALLDGGRDPGGAL